MACNSVKNVFDVITACQLYFNRPDKPFIENPLLFTMDSDGKYTWPKQVELKLRSIYTMPKKSQTIVIVYPHDVFKSKGNDIPIIRRMCEQIREDQQMYIIVLNTLCDVSKAYKDLTANLLLPFDQVKPLNFEDFLHSNCTDMSACISSVPLPSLPYLPQSPCVTLNVQNMIVSACRLYVYFNGGTLIFKSRGRSFSWPIVYSDYYYTDIDPLLESLTLTDNMVIVRDKMPLEYTIEKKAMAYKTRGVFLVCGMDVFRFDVAFNQTNDAPISKRLQEQKC